MKKHKPNKPEEPSQSCSTAELFVLPPELLAKLGINLSQIQQPAVQAPITSPTTGTDQNLNQNSQKSLLEIRDASSIIETANLMKESVFLSPTFHQSATNLIQEEEPIAININDTISVRNGLDNADDAGMDQNIALCEKVAPVSDNSTIINCQNGMSDQHLNNLYFYEPIKEYQVENQNGNLILTDVPHSDMTAPEISNVKPKATSAVDEHFDEAYLSDCSNSYLGFSPECTMNSEGKQKLAGKIIENPNVIVTESSKWQGVHNFSSSNNTTMTPVMIHTTSAARYDLRDCVVTDKQLKDVSIAQFITESPIIPDNLGTIQNSPYVTSSRNIISRTPVDKKEKEIQVTKIVDVHNNSIIDFSDSINSIELSNNTKVVLIDSDHMQNLQNNKSSNNNISEKCSIEKDDLFTITQTLSSKSSNYTSDVKSILKINENNEKHHHNLANTVSIVKQDINIQCGTKNDSQDRVKEIVSEDNTSICISSIEDVTQVEVKKTMSEETSNICGTDSYSQDKIKENVYDEKSASYEIKDDFQNGLNEKAVIETNVISNSSSASQDRVKEIAVYLSQIANERRQHAIRSSNIKLQYMQGVEKPGGKHIQRVKLIDSAVLKTYKGTKLPKQIPEHLKVSDEVTTLDLYQLPNNRDKIKALCNQNQYCICYDFGNLAYYDCEMVYEHIHFWPHQNTNCDSEILYSIYNEEAISKQISEFVKDDQQTEYDDNKMVEDNICWNKIKECDDDLNRAAMKNSVLYEDTSLFSEHCREQKTVETTGDKVRSITSEAVDKGAKSNVQKINIRVRNRKRSSVAMDQVNDHNQPEPVKMIKCGVCDQTMLDIEWEVHQETEHHSKAWKKGEESETVSATTSIPIISPRPTRRSTRCSTTSETYVAPNCKESTINEIELTRSTRRLSKSDLSTTLPGVSSANETQRSSITNNHSSESSIKFTDNNLLKSKEKIANSKVIKDLETAKPNLKSSIAHHLIKTPENSELLIRRLDSSTSLSIKTVKDVDSNVCSTSVPMPTNIKIKEKSKCTSRNSQTKILNNEGDTNSTVNVDTTNDQVEVPICNTNKYSNLSPVSNEKLLKGHKGIESAISPTVSKMSTGTETIELLRPTKRASKNESVGVLTKKFKTVESYAKLTPTNKSLKVSDSMIKTAEVPQIVKKIESDTDAYEKMKDTKISPISEIFDEKIINKPIDTVNPKITVKKPMKKMDVSSKLEKSECNSSATVINAQKIEKKSLKQKKKNTSSPKNAEVELNIVELPCEVEAAIDSALSNELTIIPAMNDSQTLTESSIVHIDIEAPIQLSGNLTRCGVCAKSVENSQWIEHISKEHDYIAWRYNEPPLDLEDEEAVKHHLQVISKYNEGLVCSKCGLVRKFAKSFIRHVRNCNGTEKDTANTSTASELDSTQEHDEPSPLSTPRKSRAKYSELVPPPVTCGVCSMTVEQTSWIKHIQLNHKYLAWKEGETPINVENATEVKSHLSYISKHHGGLLCSKCGTKRIYVKNYLEHEESCDPNKELESHQDDIKIKVELTPIVICGVCKINVESQDWINHIHRTHEYLAWIDGEDPIDVNDPKQVKKHLQKIVKMAGELTCLKCGVSRKNEHGYSQHIKACTNSGFYMEILEHTSLPKDKYECGVCHQIGNIKEWKDHAMKKHYNVAWKVGEIPINLRNPYAVEKYLKVYQKSKGLTCNHCKATRASCYGFYAHILTCGKSEEEIEAVHNVCEICNNKYLCVYRNQHVAMHREQVYKQELKEIRAKQADEEAKRLVEEKESGQPTGRRRAAQKAKKVIEKITSNVVDGKHVCTCGTTFENESERSHHECTQKNSDGDDSDVSVKIEAESETGESEIDENISDEELIDRQKTRIRHRNTGEGSSKIALMPYRVSNYMSYLVQSFKDFCNKHLTSNILFIEWRNSNHEVVPKDEMSKYLPPLTESCKVKYDNLEWTTYKRFEAKKFRGYSVFTGGAIQCISWAPHNIADETLGNYLAVVTHLAADVPKHGPHETPEYPGLIQIWDFQQFNFPPRCSLALAHDYGVVWAIDWCPSGARDRIPNGCNDLSSYRLGLLAVACSNGTAYILDVSYPPARDEEDTELVMYKLRPVAEMRLSMFSEKRIYQATTIKWSEQKGHDIIIVGYSDGTTAFYDLNTESPFLKETENDVTIFYPFQDKRSENSAVTGVGICPTANESYAMGGFCSTSATGGAMSAWPTSRPSVRTHLAIGAACYSAHWPSVMLIGDAPFMRAVNELEWWGGGRRLGAARAAAACARCGRAVCAAAPAVRMLRAHPCYPELRKLIVATLLMVPIAQKRKRKVNDDLSVVIEPRTYEDAVAKYGLHMSTVHKNDQVAAQKLCLDNEHCSDRFPLSDIVSAAFCPSSRFHEKLALGTHAGLIFIITD